MKNLKNLNLLNNQKGSIPIVLSAVVLGISTYVSMNSFNATNVSVKKNAESVKEAQMQVAKEKLIKLSGYMVSNSLIICRQGAFDNSEAKNSCQWNATPTEGSQYFNPKDFKLKNEGLNKNNELVLRYNVNEVLKTNIDDLNYIYADDKNINLSNLRFSLKKASKVGINVISTDPELDQDEDVVYVEGDILYSHMGKNELKESFAAAFRRPIAIPKVSIRSSGCDMRCDSSRSENPYKPCRSEDYIDPETKSTLNMVTQNLGPGVLYDIEYKQQVYTYTGTKQSNAFKTGSSASVPISNVLLPNGVTQWANEIGCATVYSNKTQVQYVRNELNPVVPTDIISKWANHLVDGVFGIEVAHAQINQTKSEKVSQHNEPVAVIDLCLTDCVDKSGKKSSGKLEPNRKLATVLAGNEVAQIDGLSHETTTVIYMRRPH